MSYFGAFVYCTCRVEDRTRFSNNSSKTSRDAALKIIIMQTVNIYTLYDVKQINFFSYFIHSESFAVAGLVFYNRLYSSRVSPRVFSILIYIWFHFFCDCVASICRLKYKWCRKTKHPAISFTEYT